MDGASVDTDRIDGVFEALANERRRAVVAALRAAPDDRLSLEALVDAAVERCGHRDRSSFAVSLNHVHLPKLASVGAIHVHDETVEYHGDSLLEECLDALDTE